MIGTRSGVFKLGKLNIFVRHLRFFAFSNVVSLFTLVFMMKRLFPLLASIQIALGQSTAITCFEHEHEEGQPIFDHIGIVPVEDLQKANAEIIRLKGELELIQAQPKTNKLKDKNQEKPEMVDRINEMEKERAVTTERLKKSLAVLQLDFDKQQEAWEKSVADWQVQVQKSFRQAQIKSAQESVANTSRLAKEWQAERAELQNLLIESEQLRVQEAAAWEEAVATWQQKTEEAMRSANIEEAKSAVANTARLAADWQRERNQLEILVKEMSAQMVQLEAELGLKGFEEGQEEILRLGLKKKSKALEDISTDASMLAAAWRGERETARRELEAMRALYKSTARDVKTGDQRVKQLETSLTKKNNALIGLAEEAEQLTKSWNHQRGGLQKKLLELEQQLAVSQKKVGSSKDEKKLALVADLEKKLVLSKEREGELRSGLAVLRGEVGKLKKGMLSFQEQRAGNEEELASLRAELKQVKNDYALCQQELEGVRKKLKMSNQEVVALKSKATELNEQLAQSHLELKTVRREAEANEKARLDAEANHQKVQVLENNLGQLAATHQVLEGTLLATLGDFEKLQKSYLKLQAKAVGGGRSLEVAMAAKAEAEKELQALRQKLKGEAEKLKQAQKELEKARKRQKEVEAQAKAGKAALGKSEADLAKSRKKLKAMELDQKVLEQEAEELRKRFVRIEPVSYQLASTNVVAQQQRVLAEVKQVLEVYEDARFSIRGHTCNIGKQEDNLKLSENRAIILRDFLVSNGLEENRFALVEGCGDTEPRADNETDEGRSQNRRVEIKVIK